MVQPPQMTDIASPVRILRAYDSSKDVTTDVKFFFVFAAAQQIPYKKFPRIVASFHEACAIENSKCCGNASHFWTPNRFVHKVWGSHLTVLMRSELF